MKSFLLKFGFITALTVSLFNGKVSAETHTDWASKCSSFGVTIHFKEGIAKLNDILINNDHPVSKDGNYTLVVKDSVQNKTTVIFTIDKKAPAMPIVSTVSDLMTKVCGKTEANAVVKLSINSKYVKSVVAASNGSFQIPTSKQKSGTKISVTATDKANNVSVSRTVVVIDKTSPEINC